MVSKKALVVGGVTLGLAAIIGATSLVSYISHIDRNYAAGLNAANARVTALQQNVSALQQSASHSEFYRQDSSGISYVVIGEDVNLAGLQRLLDEYDARMRKAVDEPLARIGLERRALSSGDLYPLIRKGKPAGASVFFRTFEELGGIGRRVYTPSTDQVAKAAFGNVPTIEDLGVNIAKGSSDVSRTALEGLERRLPDGSTASATAMSATTDFRRYIIKSP